MIENEINAYNATLLTNEVKSKNLKKNIEEIYKKIKLAIKKGKNSVCISINKKSICIKEKEFLWIISNILISQGYKVNVSKEIYVEYENMIYDYNPTSITIYW